LLAAKLRAAAHVRRFAERLKSGDADLHLDLKRARRIAIAESVRNSMIALCKSANFFPPWPSPQGVDDEDCSWDELGLASAPVIAQRLYNDEMRRQQELADGTAGSSALLQAKTASFLVDFADGIGIELPETTSTCRADMLEKFQDDVQKWASKSEQPLPQEVSALHTLFEDGKARVAKADKWLEKKDLDKRLLLTFAVAGFVGLGVHIAASTASRAYKTRAPSHDDPPQPGCT
jgi:hypothetical protein